MAAPFETGLYDFLTDATDAPAVRAIIGTRMYPVILPQNVVYPAISYHRVSGVRLRSLSGPVGRATPRIRFHCWAVTYLAAKNLADELRLALDGYTGPVGSFQTDRSSLESDMDIYDDDADVHRVVVDFFFSHPETVAA